MNYSNSQRAGVILYLTASLFGGYDFSTKNKGHSNRHAPNFYNSNAFSIFYFVPLKSSCFSYRLSHSLRRTNQNHHFSSYLPCHMVLAPCNHYTNKESYPRSPRFSNIAITSGCVGVNLIPRFNIPITFLAFCSISLAVCSLVSIR